MLTEGIVDAYVSGWSVLVVASSGVDSLVLVDSMGFWQRQGGGGGARLAVLYPLILVHCGPTWLTSCVSLKQLIYHRSSSLVALNSALVSSQLTVLFTWPCGGAVPI